MDTFITSSAFTHAAKHDWVWLALIIVRCRLELAEAGGEAALMIALAWGRWRTFYGARCLMKQHIARLHENAEASHMRMAFHAWRHSVGAAKSGGAEEAADSAERYRAEGTVPSQSQPVDIIFGMRQIDNANLCDTAKALKEETARLRAQLAKMASHVRGALDPTRCYSRLPSLRCIRRQCSHR
jgi:hypothetical protein